MNRQDYTLYVMLPLYHLILQVLQDCYGGVAAGGGSSMFADAAACAGTYRAWSGALHQGGHQGEGHAAGMA
jgi:hypothetical protein